MPIELVPLATSTISLAEPFMLPGTPAGTRVIAEVEDAVMEGDRLRGKLKGHAAADWMTLSAELVGTLDVRALLETHDGALVYSWYHGRLDSRSRPDRSRSMPRSTVGDERYRWLNTIQAVGKGTLSDDARTLTYELYELR